MALVAEPAANSHGLPLGTQFRNCQSLSPLYPEGLGLRVFRVPFWTWALPHVALASP